MTHVVWSDAAVRQIDGIVAYIELFDPAAAGRMADRLFSAGQSLVGFPNRGRPAAHGTRELTTVPPYIMSYEVRDGTATILSVRHGAQRPPD